MSELSKQGAIKALERLGDLLEKHGKKTDMVVAGGIISLLIFDSRLSTKDIDAIFPDNLKDRKLLKKLIMQVAGELHIRKDWLNDSMSFFGLQTRSDMIVFRHSHLVLRAAKWEELLSHKIHAFRRKTDIDDAKLILKQIVGYGKEELFSELKKYQPISPHISDDIFRKRFDQLWDEIR